MRPGIADANGDGVLTINEIFSQSVAGLDANIESLTNPETLKEIFGMDVLVLQGEFDQFFRENEDTLDPILRADEPRYSFQTSRVEQIADQLSESDIAAVKETLTNLRPEQTEFIDELSALGVAGILRTSYLTYKGNDPDSGDASANANLIFDDEANIIGGMVTLPPQDGSMTWENFMGANYFDQDINFPYENDLLYLTILGHELEHLGQLSLKSNVDAYEGFESSYSADYIRELDADNAALNMIRQAFPTKAEADAYIQYYHAARTVQTFSNGGQEYRHEFARDALAEGEMINPDAVIDVTSSVFREVRTLMYNYAHEDRLTEQWEQTGRAMNGESLFILKQMSLSDDYTPQQQAYIGEAIEAFELIGITPVDIREPLPEAEAEVRSELGSAFDNARDSIAPTPEPEVITPEEPVAPVTPEASSAPAT